MHVMLYFVLAASLTCKSFFYRRIQAVFRSYSRKNCGNAAGFAAFGDDLQSRALVREQARRRFMVGLFDLTSFDLTSTRSSRPVYYKLWHTETNEAQVSKSSPGALISVPLSSQ